MLHEQAAILDQNDLNRKLLSHRGSGSQIVLMHDLLQQASYDGDGDDDLADLTDTVLSVNAIYSSYDGTWLHPNFCNKIPRRF